MAKPPNEKKDYFEKSPECQNWKELWEKPEVEPEEEPDSPICECCKKLWKKIDKPDTDKISSEMSETAKKQFLGQVISAYNYHAYKAEYNKYHNFLIKEDFVWIVLANGLVELAILAYLIFKMDLATQPASLLAICAVVAVAGFNISAARAKWAGVKKYQETWSRHSFIRSKMELEMSRFVYRSGPYEDLRRSNREKVFVSNMIEIWEANIALFQSNMDSKELTLTDILKYPQNI